MKKVVKTFLVFGCVILGSLNVRAQVITTFAGTGGGGFSGDGGPATLAQTPLPASGAFDGAGNYYFFESAGTPRIRKINTSGIITTVVGNGTFGFSGDGGPATAAAIKNSFFDVDAIGNIFIADLNNNRVRMVDVSTGIIHTIAGNGTATSTGDGGPATSATISPIDLCVDGYGNLFVSDMAGSIRKISTSSIISTVALGSAQGMCINKKGNLCVGGNLWVFKIDTATGHKDTIGGTGIATYNGDEIPATTANFKVYDLAIDKIGNLFIATYSGQRIRKIDTFGVIHTVAGTGIAGYSGDLGAATIATISNPEGVAVDACGNIYIADLGNNRIRRVAQTPIYTTPTISLTGAVSAPAGTTVTVTATVASAGSSYIVHWLNHGLEFTTTTVPSVTYTKPPGIDTITARIVPTGWGCWDSTVSAGHIVVEGPTGHVPISQNANVQMWPNPVGDMLNISGNVVAYRIITIVGAVVQQGAAAPGTTRIPLPTLPPGTYLLEATSTTGQKTVTRMIKE